MGKIRNSVLFACNFICLHEIDSRIKYGYANMPILQLARILIAQLTWIGVVLCQDNFVASLGILKSN